MSNATATAQSLPLRTLHTASPRLPVGWAQVSLGDIRKDLARSVDPRTFQNTPFVLYSVPRHELGEPEFVKGSEIGSNKQTVEPGTVLLCKINPRINRVWIIREHAEGRLIASTEWIPFFPVEGVDPRYLAFFLQQSDVREYLAQNVSGVGGSLMRVRPAVVDRFQFALAPTREQSRVVAEIEKHFTRLDDAVKALKRTQINLKRYRASILKAACEGRLVSTEADRARKEARDYKAASELLKNILAERRAKWESDQLARMTTAGKVPTNDHWKKKYKEPEPPDATNLPPLPQGWAWASAEQITEFITDGEHITPERADSGVLLLSARNVQNGSISLKDVDHVPERVYEILCRRLKVIEGDVLLSCSGSVGRSCVVPANLTFALVRSVAVLRPILVNPEYVSSALRSPFLQEQIRDKSTQTAQANIFQGKIKTLIFPLPPEPEQERIVEALETRMSSLNAMLSETTASVGRAAALRSATLSWAFSGKLVPQDSSDEPASLLLERIQSERAKQAADKKPGKIPPKRAVTPVRKRVTEERA